MVKASNIVGLIFLAVVLFIVGWRLSENIKIVPKGSIVISQTTLDSLDAYIKLADSLEILANIPPDTILNDTTIYEQIIVYLESIPIVTVDPVDTTLKSYTDSIYKEGEIHAWVKYKVRGFVEGQSQWGYKPIIKEIETIIKKTVPYPVIEEIEVPKMITGNYLSLTAGGNDKMFIFGVDYDYVQENIIYGLQYRRFGNASVYGVKIGINLNTLYNKIRNGP